MRKLQKAAVVAAMLGGVSVLGAGSAFAGGHGAPSVDFDATQACTANTTTNQGGLINLNDTNLGLGLLGQGTAGELDARCAGANAIGG